LIRQNPGVKLSADDGLIAEHRCFNQTPAIIARTSLPAHASMLCNGHEMFVTLRRCRFTCNGCNPWWNNHRCFWVTLGNGAADGLAIVCPVCRHRRNVSTDLVEEGWQFGDVTDIIRRQFHRDDFMCIGIDTEMQLAPAPARADAVFLIKPFALIGPRLRAREFFAQRTEAAIGVAVLNRMLVAGRSKSIQRVHRRPAAALNRMLAFGCPNCVRIA
jgi:hypothetical protein